MNRGTENDLPTKSSLLQQKYITSVKFSYARHHLRVKMICFVRGTPIVSMRPEIGLPPELVFL